ncbi:MAG: alpha/beta hydrolase [Chloroflexi bacterium]|nr:alpha/beta hydrolase [Chloroflexota bacterium]
MRQSAGHTETEGGLRLVTRPWLPDGKPKAILAFSHGIGEHTGRYEGLARALAEAGYALHMADLRGHGESPGKRGHIGSFSEYREDFAAIVQSAWDAAPEAPYFIGGHSLGGLIALNAALDQPLGARGIVVSAPALGLAFEPPAWKVAAARILSAIAPAATFPSGLDTDALCRDGDVVAAYRSDPLVHDAISARAYTEMMAAQRETLANAGRLQMPLLLMHGTADRLTNYEHSRLFYERAGSTDKLFKTYDGFYHELFNEPDKEQVFADLIEWLDAHT